MTVAEINKLIQELPSEERGKVSDGYHSFDEYNKIKNELWLTVCRLQSKINQLEPGKRDIWKSLKHSDESTYEGWFIIGINESYGDQITFHLPISFWTWCYFAKTLEKAVPWDGHDTSTTLNRLKSL